MIRPECLQPAAQAWAVPTPDEINEVIRLAGLSSSYAARVLGLGEKGGRAVRRWMAGEAAIPYSAWAVLCHMAGLGIIWSDAKMNDDEFSG